MAQLFNSRNRFTPIRKLINSQASSSSSQEGYGEIFFAESADIPDDFLNSEAPKMKYLFTVEFKPRDELSLSEVGSSDMTTMKFALKRSTRPNPTISYQDINFYGYRTKVATKMDYGALTLSFFDDVTDRAHDLFLSYLNLISPISNVSRDDVENLLPYVDKATFNPTENNTLNPSFITDGNANSVGPLVNALGPFAYIRVSHFMYNVTNPTRTKVIYYDYINPKITNFNLDELDMSQSDASSIELTFVYDSVSVDYGTGLDEGFGGLGFSNTSVTIQSGTNAESGLSIKQGPSG